MKQKLLLLGISLLMSAAAFAQWTKPTCEGAEMQFSSSEIGDTTMYYLYNEEADAFFTEGNAWGTQASWTNEPFGLKVFFTKYLVDGEWDGKTFFINDFSIAKNGWKRLFIDNAEAMYVDLGNQANFYWECIPNGKAYRFFGASKNPDFNPENEKYTGKYMGVDLDLGTTILYPYLDIESEGTDIYKVDWKLIPVDGEYVQQRLIYNAAIKLGALIEQTEADYPELTSALDEAKAVYNNYSATADELNDAIKDLQLAVNYASIAGATNESPKDATQFFKNPDFSAGNIDGWDCTFEKDKNVTNLGYQGANYTNGDVSINQFIEAWANSVFNTNYSRRCLGDGQLSQTLPNLPAGKYKFACDAIAVTQDDVNTPCSGVFLFAESGDIKPQTAIHTGNEKPEHFEFTFVTTGDDVTLGLKTVNTNANWIAADNFTLTYYGELADDPEKVILDEYINVIDAKYPDFDEVYANAEIKDAFLEALDAARNATEDYANIQTALEESYAAFEVSVADYERFAEIIADARDFQARFSGTKFEVIGNELEDLLMDWEGFYEDGEVDAAYIANAKDQVHNIVVVNITDLMEAGDDVSVLLDNPSFDKGFSGWQFTGAQPAWGGINPNTIGLLAGVEMTSGNAEVYHAAFDMFQVVRNMPKGSFTVTCQAFERNDDGYAAHWAIGPEEGITGSIYVNNTEKKLKNILADAAEESIFGDGTWWDDVMTDYGYIPNGMPGANYHFNNPNNPTAYVNKVNITLPQAGDSITIGIKTSGTNSWILFDNFRLVYNGAGADAYYEQIDELIEQLQAVFDEASLYGVDAQDSVNAAIVVLKDARAGFDGDACADAVAAGEAALKYAKTSIADYNKLSTQIDELSGAIELYAETADPEAIDAAGNLYDKASDVLDTQSATNEKVEAILAEINKVIATLKLPANYKEATEENPVDLSALIVNANFDTIGDFTGWSGTAFGAGGTTSTCAEHYNKTYDTYQDVVGLPAGYYIVKAKGYYRRGTADNEYSINEENADSCLYAQLYAQADGNEESVAIQPQASGAVESGFGGATAAYGPSLLLPNTMEAAVHWFEAGYYDNELVIEVGEDGTLRIGVRKSQGLGEDWSIFDTFQIFYLGTDAPVVIDSIEENATATVGIYNLAGQKLQKLQKGLNIINGKKIFVK
ncbi:MAG: hypothetical protein MJY90_07440 [Bacteroidaceae bacterium]|nr:hypothetical protein [Bacteroidaceae bacterium]